MPGFSPLRRLSFRRGLPPFARAVALIAITASASLAQPFVWGYPGTVVRANTTTTTAGEPAIHGRAFGPGSGVLGVCNASTGSYGVSGFSLSTDRSRGSFAPGVHGTAQSRRSPGVYGENFDHSGIGILGKMWSTYGTGVRGEATASLGGYGVYGYVPATSGYAFAVYGRAGAALDNGTGGKYGCRGVAYGKNAYGVAGYANGRPSTRTASVSGVYGSTGTTLGYGMFSSGNFGSSGTKSFLNPHPTDPAKMIQFMCLEGNENGTYFRGKTKAVSGIAEIPIPEAWRHVTAADGITLQLTAIGSLTARLAVMELSRERIVVHATEDCAFCYTVNGVRRGFEAYEPYLANTAFRPTTRDVPFGAQYPEGIRRMLVENGTLNVDFTPNTVTAARLGWKLERAETDAGPDGPEHAADRR